MVTELKKRYFSAEEISQIEKTIAEIERTTSGELVVVLAPSSDSYFRVRLMGGMVGWLLGTVVALLFENTGHWGYPFWKLFIIQVMGLSGGVALSYIPYIGRLLVPKRIRNRNVHREALAQFSALGLHATKEHTGVLILMSVFERSVHILGDRGIHSKVGPEDWKKYAEKIAQGFIEKKPAVHLMEVLIALGKTLADHFPPNDHNPNELPNKVRFI